MDLSAASSSAPDALLLLKQYYHTHQPKPNDPRNTNVDLVPPLTPCYCQSCEAVRSMEVVLSPQRDQQLLWIMQGAPGSGKSHLAKAIAREHPGTIICSTDTYSTTRMGEYVWSMDKLASNHAANTRRAITFLTEGRSVIVDNTNIAAWQPREYVRHAVKLGIRVEFKRATGNFPNNHGVPKEKVEEMRRSYEVLTIESVLSSLTPAERNGGRGGGGVVMAPPPPPPPPSSATVIAMTANGGEEEKKKGTQGEEGRGGNTAAVPPPGFSYLDKAMGKLSC